MGDIITATVCDNALHDGSGTPRVFVTSKWEDGKLSFDFDFRHIDGYEGKKIYTQVRESEYIKLVNKQNATVAKYEEYKETHPHTDLEVVNSDELNKYKVEYAKKNEQCITLQSNYNDMKSNYNDMKSNYQTAQKNYQEYLAKYNTAQKNYQDYLAKYENTLSQYNAKVSQIASLQQSVKDTQAKYENTLSQYNAKVSQIASLQQSVKDTQAKYENTLSQYNAKVSQIASLQQSVKDTQAKYNTAQSNYQEYLAKYNTAQKNYQDYLAKYNTAQSNYQTAQKNYQDYLAKYNAAQSNYQTAHSNYVKYYSEYYKKDTQLKTQYTSFKLFQAFPTPTFPTFAKGEFDSRNTVLGDSCIRLFKRSEQSFSLEEATVEKGLIFVIIETYGIHDKIADVIASMELNLYYSSGYGRTWSGSSLLNTNEGFITGTSHQQNEIRAPFTAGLVRVELRNLTYDCDIRSIFVLYGDIVCP